MEWWMWVLIILGIAYGIYVVWLYFGGGAQYLSGLGTISSGSGW